MRLVKRKRTKGAWVPFTLRPRKKYLFRTPIPPQSIVKVKTRFKSGSLTAGRKFRVGYYSWRDGLDCIWLVNKNGEYVQTIDHDFMQRHFEIVEQSRERSLYGKGKPPFLPIS